MDRKESRIEGYGPNGRPFRCMENAREAFVTQLENMRNEGDQTVWRAGPDGTAKVLAIRYANSGEKQIGIYEIMGTEVGNADLRTALGTLFDEPITTQLGDHVTGWTEDGSFIDLPEGPGATPHFMCTLDLTRREREFLIGRWVAWAGDVNEATAIVERTLLGDKGA